MDPETLAACYQILGLTPDAKYHEIKHAYRTLVKRWHPDRFATDLDQQRQALEHFHAVTHAYAMLRAHRTAADLSRLHGHWWRQGVCALSWATRGTWCLGIGVLIVVGCYALQPTYRHAVPSAPSARLPGDLAQSVSPRAYVTVGSTHAAVRAIQGTPTWATDPDMGVWGITPVFQGRACYWMGHLAWLSPQCTIITSGFYQPRAGLFYGRLDQRRGPGGPGNTDQSDRASVGIWGVARVLY